MSGIEPLAVVVAQLAERSLLTPEIRGSNHVIGNELLQTYICQLLSRKDEIKKKRQGMAQFKKRKVELNPLNLFGQVIFLMP